MVVGGTGQVISQNKSINNSSTNPGRGKSGGTANYIGGTAAAPLTIEPAAQDRGPVADGYRDNFAMGVLRLNPNSFISLVEAADNSPGAAAEALYVDSLIVPNGATLDLNGRKVYVRVIEFAGTGAIIGGTATIIPDGGPILYAMPTSGKIAVSGEQDEWTFFGRANQTVSVVMNSTGFNTPGSPGALNPTLQLGRLTLFSPTGTDLGSVQGGVSTLANIVLPVNGTYRLRMQAPLNEPTRMGVYNLAVYDVTAETRPLLLNAITAGNIETPSARDRWTFSLDAGQQVQFDLIAAVTSGLQFTLEGPDGFVAFNNITDDSTLTTVPSGRGGNYVLTAKGQTDQTGAYSFIVRDGSITPLTLGSTYAGVLPGSGSPRWFKMTLPNIGQLLVTLDDSSNADRNQLYLRKGALPTREVYDFRHASYDSDEQIYVPNASAGDWYVLLYGDHVPSPSNYTLKAEYSDLRITSVTPDRYGVNNTMTMTLSGGGFEPGASVKLISGVTTINPTTTEIDSFTQITATFNLVGAPQQTFDVRVEKGSLNFTLPGEFRTLPDAPAHLETKLIMPGFASRTRVTSLGVEYANTGNVAMPAPLMIVQSADPEGDQHAILSLDPTRTFETFWATKLPHGTSERVMMLGSGAVAGVLNPGERMTIPVQYLGEKPPFETTDPLLQLELKCVHEGHGDAGSTIAWPALKNALRPPTVPAAIWDQVYANITGPLATVEAYAAMLIANAQYLGRLGLRVTDIDELWNFEVRKALGVITAFPTLGSAVDAQVPAPGTPLTLTRRFSDGVISRNIDGPFGHGWTVPWFATITRDATNDVITLHSGAGSERAFLRDARGSTPLSPSATYFSGVGDSSSMKRVSAGVYELRDTGGTVTRFRADGRIDYVQDTNGNRVTAQYNGAGRLVTLDHSAGSSISIGYNGAGHITVVTDSLGHSVTYAYDPAGDHLLSATGDDGTTTTYTYDTTDNLMRRHALLSEETGGTARFFTYDANGRIASSSLPGGVQLVNVSYSSGRITLSDASGAGQLFFDHKARLAKVTNARGFSTMTRYDKNDRLASVTLPDGSTQRYEWCDCGSMLGSIDELGQSTTYGRHPITRKVTSVTDAKRNVSRLTYDAAGNQLLLIHADGTSEGAGNETPAGLPQLFTNRRGQTSNYVYNAAGQVTRRTAPGGAITDKAYDARGRLMSITQGADVTTLAYDTAVDGDRLKRITYPGARFVEYDYDDAGRRVATRDQSGFTTRFDYDAAGRLFRARDTARAALATYTFDTAGRITRVDNGNNTFTTYGYDAAGNVLSIENFRSAGVLNSKFVYTYDARDRRTTATTAEGTWAYGYDATGQLTSATFASTSPNIANQNIQISYGAAGNRTFMTVNGDLRDYGSNALNQYTRVDGVNYAYDADGNLTFDGTRQYAYDDLNRLTQVEVGTDVQQFEYNALGGRSATVVNGVRTEYLVSPDLGASVLTEYDGTGALLAHNIFAGSLLGHTTGAGAVNFFDFDITGSTAGVSDATGAYINRYAYDPFGQTLFSDELLANPYEFIGQFGVRGEIGGLSQMGFRDYSAELGRFTTIDPLRLKDDVNTYRYAANSPTMNIDPLGLFVQILEGALEGGQRYVLGHLYAGAVSHWSDVAQGSRPGFGDAATSIAINAGFSYPGVVGVSYAISLSMNPEVNQNFVPAACGLAHQREFGTINRGAAMQLAAINAELGGGGAGGGTVDAACLEGFPGSGDADMGIGDRCGYGESNLASRPIDPNDKIPPLGFGPQNRVAIESPISYTIDFENLGPGSVDENGDPYPVVAAVPAQRVSISDQLSTDLDFSTVQFTEFSFGEAIVPVSDGFGAFHASVPAELNGVSFVVQIDAEIDVASGILSVIFQAVDAMTGLPPDPFIGLLPPEDGSSNGMGYFKFSVKPISTVADGTPIRNVAIIKFDSNDVIPTNQADPLDPTQGTDPAREALVTIDSLPPTVIAGPVFEFDAPSPRVSLQFSEDVQASLSATSAVIENLTTSNTTTATGLLYDASTNTATFTLDTLLADGNYHLTLPALNVADGVGHHLATDAELNFFFLSGDANRDRSLNIGDFSILASKFNTSLPVPSEAEGPAARSVIESAPRTRP